MFNALVLNKKDDHKATGKIEEINITLILKCMKVM